MRWLLFLSRLSFISGICLLIWLGFSMTRHEISEVVTSSIITIAIVLGFAFLPVTNICYLIMTLAGKKIGTVVPRWLIVMNILFLFLLLFYVFYLNDPYYHP